VSGGRLSTHFDVVVWLPTGDFQFQFSVLKFLKLKKVLFPNGKKLSQRQKIYFFNAQLEKN
jgi:hypothetical protein